MMTFETLGKATQEDIFFKMISEIADYAILLMDTNGIIQNWNLGAERIKGYRAEEIIGKNCWMYSVIYRPVLQKQKPVFM